MLTLVVLSSVAVNIVSSWNYVNKWLLFETRFKAQSHVVFLLLYIILFDYCIVLLIFFTATTDFVTASFTQSFTQSVSSKCAVDYILNTIAKLQKFAMTELKFGKYQFDVTNFVGIL